MSDLFALTAGIAAILAAAVLSASGIILLEGAKRAGGTRFGGMAQVVFLPEKRKRYLWLMSVEGSLFTLSAICWGLLELALVPNVVGTIAFAAAFLGAFVFLTWRTILGLRPLNLTDADRASMRKDAQTLLSSLAFIPLDNSKEAVEARQRLYVLALPQDDFGASQPASAAAAAGRRRTRSRTAASNLRERREE